MPELTTRQVRVRSVDIVRTPSVLAEPEALTTNVQTTGKVTRVQVSIDADWWFTPRTEYGDRRSTAQINAS